ncbi:hypothetical protein VARIO8X_110147 [Burkholderiales bacterium 8X]|nr:hypothetical protein VARIO8X_110147 [Burkholderiales bacterium 8X]
MNTDTTERLAAFLMLSPVARGQVPRLS